MDHFSRQVLDTLSATTVSYRWCLMSLSQVPSTLSPKILASKPWLPVFLVRLLGLAEGRSPVWLPANHWPKWQPQSRSSLVSQQGFSFYITPCLK